MSSTTDLAPSDTDSAANIEALSDHKILVDTESLKKDKDTEDEVLFIESDESAPEVEIPDNTEKGTLGFPFHSPKTSHEGPQCHTPLEGSEVETCEDTPKSTIVTHCEAVDDHGGQNEVYHNQEDGAINTEDGLKVTDSNNGFDSVNVEGSNTLTDGDRVSQNEEIPAPAASICISVPAAANSSAETSETENASLTFRTAGQAPDTLVEMERPTIVNEDALREDTKETTLETPTDTRPARSVPPHLRPDFQPSVTRPGGMPDSWHAFREIPRVPRAQYPTYQPSSHRYDTDSEQLARTRAQLMKTQNELNSARKQKVHLRTIIEAEQLQKIDAAFSSMLSALLQKQAEALSLKSDVEAKQRNLTHREKMIEQFEVYLAEGQKQVKYQLEHQGIRTMDEVNRELIKREADLSAKKCIADMEGKLSLQSERIHLREAAQQMREQQYKSLVRSAIESEIHAVAISPEKAAETAKEEFTRGFAEGKEAGRKDALDEAQQEAFVHGYAACRRAQIALHDLRTGRIARDSAELDFLFDAGHVENLFNRGLQIGRLQGGGGWTETTAVSGHAVHGNGKEMGKKPGKQEQVRDNLHLPLPPPPPPNPTLAAQLRALKQPQPQPLHNGHIVLANNSSASLPTPATSLPTSAATAFKILPASTSSVTGNGAIGMNGMNGTHTAAPTVNGTLNGSSNGSSNGSKSNSNGIKSARAFPGHVGVGARAGEGAYAGRTVVRYEYPEPEPKCETETKRETKRETETAGETEKEVNLIDLL
ncbi:Nn.00g066160.m01.CDS01 [Neocucurbitaria sp. VM-36]